MIDQNSKVNLQVVQGNFPIKYGPKTLKHPWSIYSKTFGQFKIIIYKYNEKYIYFYF